MNSKFLTTAGSFVALLLASTSFSASFTVGGFTWDSDNAVTSASFTEGGPGFIAATSFAEGTKSIGNHINGTSPGFADITNTITNTDRHTLTVNWGSAPNGSVLPNQVGTDLIIYETGSVGAPEAFAISVRDAQTGAFSPYHFFWAASFDAASAAFATPVDLSNIDPAITGIDRVSIRSIFNSAGPNGGDRVDIPGGSGQGQVAFDVGVGNFTNRLLEAGPQGSAGEFPASRLDADIVYVVGLHNTVNVPEPTALSLVLCGLVAKRRRRG